MPEPVDPTSAVVVPAGTSRSMSASVGGPAVSDSSYRNATPRIETSPRRTSRVPAPGLSPISTRRSSTSKIRPNSAFDVATFCPIVCIALAGATSRLSMLVNATTVPSEIGDAPFASASPAIQ